MKLKKHVDYNKLLKDIHKGQSMQMLCYLYKIDKEHIKQFAKKHNLEVFDPVSIPDRTFMNCSIGLSSRETFKLTSGWM